jgi:(E)-4-hydroxy-3-methylbut-2-enyl-diphosphate synthase
LCVFILQRQTGHLPGVSIAIMGCIVNGPGEMADADFGYVGTLPGKIDLYVGREVSSICSLRLFLGLAAVD